MKHAMMFAGVAAMSLLCLPATAQTQETATLDTQREIGPAEDQKVAEFTAMMSKLFAAKPLTSEQEARVPAARQVVGTMTPPGFYGDMMDGVMQQAFGSVAEMVSGPMAADDILDRKVGIAADELPELTEAQRGEIVALLDPAAKQRAEVVTAKMGKGLADMFRQFEAPLRDGLTKAFAVRFSDSELRDIRTFFATPAGASFARQSFAVYADPQVMSAMMSQLPQMMQSMPQMFEGLEASVANLPKERDYADLSAAERQRLAKLLGMSEADLRRAMTKAERERAKEDQADG